MAEDRSLGDSDAPEIPVISGSVQGECRGEKVCYIGEFVFAGTALERIGRLERELAEARGMVKVLEESRENWMRRAERLAPPSAPAGDVDMPCASCEVPREILERIRPAVKSYVLKAAQSVLKCKNGLLPAHYLETLQKAEFDADALLCAVDDILSITRRVAPSAAQDFGDKCRATGMAEAPSRVEREGYVASSTLETSLDLKHAPSAELWIESPSMFLDGWGGKELPPTFHAYAERLYATYKKLALAASSTELSVSPEEWKQLVESAREEGRIAGRLEAVAASATKRIPGIGLLKTMKKQRDGLADVVREIRTRMQAVHSSGRLGQEISDADRAWLSQVDAALDGVPTYEQQLRNIAEGIGMTYEELVAAMSRVAPPEERRMEPTDPDGHCAGEGGTG